MPTGDAGDAPSGKETNDSRVAMLSDPLLHRIVPIDFHLYPIGQPTGDRRDNFTDSGQGNAPVTGGFLLSSSYNPGFVQSIAGLPMMQDAGLEIHASGAGSTPADAAPGGDGTPMPFDGPMMYIESLGGSTGPVVRVVLVNPDPEALAFDGYAAIEPVAVPPSQRARILDQVRRAPGAHQEITANFYCLELLKQAPPGGVVYRIAGAAKQERFAPVARALDRARHLYESGGLAVEGDPDTYFHSIRQWAAWTLEQSFDRDRFLDAFVEHAHKTFTRLGQPWSDAVAAEVRRHGERRWDDVRKVVQGAD